MREDSIDRVAPTDHVEPIDRVEKGERVPGTGRKLQQVAGRVWLYPHDPDPDAIGASVGVIADERGSVLIDAGNSPAHAREIQRAITKADLPAPRWLVYTHHHWDHTWGACAWDDVEAIAHSSATEILAAEAERPWSHQYLRDQVTLNPKLGPSTRPRATAKASRST